MDTTDILPLSLPVVTIQHSFPQIIQELQDGVIPYDKFWVSCYKRSETSVHAVVHVELDEVDRDLLSFKSSEKDVEVTRDAEGVSELLDSF
jgi:proteasomal ATPase-associated factor 1